MNFDFWGNLLGNLLSGFGTEVYKDFKEKKDKEKKKQEERQKQLEEEIAIGDEKKRQLKEELKKEKKKQKRLKEKLVENTSEDKLFLLYVTFSDIFSGLCNIIFNILLGAIFIIFIVVFIELLNTPSSPPKYPSSESVKDEPEQEKDELKFSYIDADEITYPTSKKDFVTMAHPSGVYSFMYPKNFFKEAYYDEESESYTFITADGNIELNFYQTDIESSGLNENDPLKLVKLLLEENAKAFIDPYTHASDELSEDNYARCIISGNLKEDNNQAYYICMACTTDTIYSLVFKYITDGRSASEMYDDCTPISYVSQCLYRGWSISGTMQKIISYSEFQASTH